jgi:hypothetical protein
MLQKSIGERCYKNPLGEDGAHIMK